MFSAHLQGIPTVDPFLVCSVMKYQITYDIRGSVICFLNYSLTYTNTIIYVINNNIL